MNPVSVLTHRFFNSGLTAIPSVYPFLTSLFSSSIFSSTLSSSPAISNASDSPPWECGGLYGRIAKIWKNFCNAIASCFSKVYRYIESWFVTPYPEINANMSRDALLKLYWGLGRANKWRESIDGRYHHLGREVFDRGLHQGTVEPGFIASMEESYGFIEQALNRKIDADWYLNLHKHTCAHFNGDPSAFLMGQEKVGVFRDSDDPIHCTLANHYAVSQQAKNEFEALDRQIAMEFGPGYGLGEMVYTDA